jgi:uncharacterized CHY-type Zn-finger protein
MLLYGRVVKKNLNGAVLDIINGLERRIENDKSPILKLICNACDKKLMPDYEEISYCKDCERTFCIDCDIFIHETLLSCPTCQLN